MRNENFRANLAQKTNPKRTQNPMPRCRQKSLFTLISSVHPVQASPTKSNQVQPNPTLLNIFSYAAPPKTFIQHTWACRAVAQRRTVAVREDLCAKIKPKIKGF